MLKDGRCAALDKNRISVVLYKQAGRIQGETGGREKSLAEQLTDKAFLQAPVRADVPGVMLMGDALLAGCSSWGPVMPVKRHKQQYRQDDR